MGWVRAAALPAARNPQGGALTAFALFTAVTVSALELHKFGPRPNRSVFGAFLNLKVGHVYETTVVSSGHANI